MTQTVLLVQPPFVFDGADVIYPSLPCLGSVLRSQGADVTYWNLNLDYIVAQKQACLQACLRVGHSEQSLYDECRNTKSTVASLRHAYWSDFLCRMLVELGPRVDVTANGIVCVDQTHSLEGLFSHAWKPYADGVSPRVEVDPQAERIGRMVGTNEFTEFVRRAIPGMRIQDYDIVGVTVPMVENISFALVLADVVAQMAPTTRVILGGTAFSAVPNWVVSQIRDRPSVSTVVLGAGETSIVELLHCDDPSFTLDRLTSATESSGYLPVLGQARARTSESRRPMGKRRSLIGIPPVSYPRPASRELLCGEVTLLQSRGCYWGECVYCTYPELYGPNDYRERAAITLVEEMEQHCHLGYRRFRLANDTLREGYAVELAERILGSDLKVSWRSFMRAEPFSTSSLELMRESGGSGFILGLETISDRLLQLVKKGVMRRTAEELFRRCASIGLKLEVNAMPDLPTATIAEATETLDFLQQHKDVIVKLNVSPLVVPIRSPMAKSPSRYGIRILPHEPKRVVDTSLLPFEREVGASTGEFDQVIRMYLELASEIALRERRTKTDRSGLTLQGTSDSNGYSEKCPRVVVGRNVGEYEVTYRIPSAEMHYRSLSRREETSTTASG